MNINVDSQSIMVTWLEPEEAGKAFDALCLRWRAEFGDAYIDIRGSVNDRRGRATPNWIQGRLTK
jgi:hypothetical protein